MLHLIKSLSWLLLVILVAAGCEPAPTAAPVLPATASHTLSPTSLPATPTLEPSPLPTQAPVSIPEATATTLPGPERLPAGQMVTITAINMIDASSGWASGGLSGESQHILRTRDGGLTWQDVTPPQPLPEKAEILIATAHYQDAETAWAFFTLEDGRPLQPAIVWRTQAGGATWQASQQLDLRGLEWQFSVSDIQFAGPQHGWLMAHVGVGMNHDYIMLFHSQDSGESWQRLIDPYNDGGIQACYKPGMTFSDAQQGWLPVNCNGVMPGALLYHTADGGATWEMVYLPSPADQPGLFENYAVACSVDSVAFFSTQMGYAAVTCANYDTDPLTYLYYLYSTQDGGATWTEQPYPGGKPTFLNPQTGWTQNQDIYQTSDGGATWAKVKAVAWQGEFDFVSNSLVWAVAQSGEQMALVRSEDGGLLWSELEPVISP